MCFIDSRNVLFLHYSFMHYFILMYMHIFVHSFHLPCSLPEGAPDMRCCLFHQKLQMLNSCIEHKKKHDHSIQESVGAKVKSSKTHPKVTEASSVAKDNLSSSYKESAVAQETEDSDTDDEFFEALESQLPSPSAEREKAGEKSELDSPVAGGSLVQSAVEEGLESGSGRSGVLKRCGDLLLVATGKPLCIPVTQVENYHWWIS